MKLLSLVLLIVAFECSLANFASSNSCQPLNRTLFGSCINAGYNVSEFKTSTPQSQQLAILIQAAQSKLNCSRFSNLMTCSIFLPGSKCPSARLPCKDTCRSFVSDCQDGSSDIEGLLTLFNRLCQLLPTDQCLPTSMANSNTTTAVYSDNVTCHELNISQCAHAGYSHTSVSSAYQKILETSDVFNNSKDNSTLRKIICMEIAPPCDNKSNNTLLVPCKTTCEAAFNESQPQFKKIFKSIDYCSAFLKTDNVDGKYYCVLQEWPNTGYWPSDLWKRVSTAHGLAISPSSPTTKPSENNSTPLSASKSSENIVTSSTVPTTEASTSDSMSVQTTEATTTVISPTSTTQASASSTTAVATAKTSQSPASTIQVSKPGSAFMPTTQASVIGSTPSPAPTNTPAVIGSTSSLTATAPTPRTIAFVTRSSPAPNKTASINGSTTVLMTPASLNVTTPYPMQTSKSALKMGSTILTKTSTPTLRTSTSSASINVSAPVTEAPTKSKSTEPMTSRSEMTPSGSKETPKVKAHKSGKLSAGIIAGIVVGVIAGLVLFVLGVIFFRRYKRLRAQYTHSLMVNMDEL